MLAKSAPWWYVKSIQKPFFLVLFWSKVTKYKLDCHGYRRLNIFGLSEKGVLQNKYKLMHKTPQQLSGRHYKVISYYHYLKIFIPH